MPEKTERTFYRVRYPLALRPVLHAEKATYTVSDCSERGVRYHVHNGALPKIGSSLHGIVRFHSGREVPIKGKVVRINEGEVALHLDTCSIPLAVMLNEQRYVRDHSVEIQKSDKSN